MGVLEAAEPGQINPKKKKSDEVVMLLVSVRGTYQCSPFRGVKFTVSNITYYCLKWPGIVENSTVKTKIAVLLFYRTLVHVFRRK